jgi:coenzyme F420-0:L-glutamate ligase/coenzyme F420-1:gamma-L-glutamate ligase
VLAVASKLASFAEGRIVDLSEVTVSSQARKLAVEWSIDRRLGQLIIDQADQIIGGVQGFLLTITHGILTPNAGIDLKNSPTGHAALWPKDLDRSANKLRKCLESRFHVRLGLILVDSRVTPMRLGTTGLAIGVSGFSPTKDSRGHRDLFGRKVKVTQMALADDLASAAHLLMGEAEERVALVLIRNAPIHLDRGGDSEGAKLERRKCLIGSNLKT